MTGNLYGNEWLWSPQTNSAHAFSIAGAVDGESLCKRSRRGLQAYRAARDPSTHEKCMDCLNTEQQVAQE